MWLAFLTWLYFSLHSLTDTAANALTVGVILLLTGSVILIVLYATSEISQTEAVYVIKKTVTFIPKKTVVFLMILIALVPNQQNMKIIIGAYVWQYIVEVKGVSDLPTNMVSAINGWLIQMQPRNNKDTTEPAPGLPTTVLPKRSDSLSVPTKPESTSVAPTAATGNKANKDVAGAVTAITNSAKAVGDAATAITSVAYSVGVTTTK